MTPGAERLYARTFPVHVGVDTGKSSHLLVAQGPWRRPPCLPATSGTRARTAGASTWCAAWGISG